MADDGKRSENVCAKVTERMLLDLNRIAAVEDRKLSDFTFLILRRYLYGDVVRLSADSQPTSSDKVDQVGE